MYRLASLWILFDSDAVGMSPQEPAVAASRIEQTIGCLPRRPRHK